MRAMSDIQRLSRLKLERERTSHAWHRIEEIWKAHTEFKTKTDILDVALDFLEIDLTILKKPERIKEFYEYEKDHYHLRQIISMFRTNWHDEYFSKDELAWLKAHYPKVAERREKHLERISKSLT